MTKSILCALMLALGTVAGPSAVIAAEDLPPSQPTTIPGMLVEGTTVRLMFVHHVKSGAAAKGEHVALQVAENVLDPKGRVLIKQGTPATGIVTRSRKAGIIAKPGRLKIEIVSTTAADGQTVPLRRIKSHTGHHGHNFTIEPGHEVVAYVDANVPVRLASTAPAPAAQQ